MGRPEPRFPEGRALAEGVGSSQPLSWGQRSPARTEHPGFLQLCIARRHPPRPAPSAARGGERRCGLWVSLSKQVVAGPVGCCSVWGAPAHLEGSPGSIFSTQGGKRWKEGRKETSRLWTRLPPASLPRLLCRCSWAPARSLGGEPCRDVRLCVLILPFSGRVSSPQQSETPLVADDAGISRCAGWVSVESGLS